MTRINCTATTKMFLSVPNAAKLAGLSVRQFRRIVTQYGIPTAFFRRKLFVCGKGFNAWQNSRKKKSRGLSGAANIDC